MQIKGKSGRVEEDEDEEEVDEADEHVQLFSEEYEVIINVSFLFVLISLG